MTELYNLTCRLNELINHDDFENMAHSGQLQALIGSGYTEGEIREHLYLRLDEYRTRKEPLLVDHTLDLLDITTGWCHPKLLLDQDEDAKESRLRAEGYYESEEWLESLYERKESLRVSLLEVDDEIERVNKAILLRAEGKLEVIKTLLNEGVWTCKCASLGNSPPETHSGGVSRPA